MVMLSQYMVKMEFLDYNVALSIKYSFQNAQRIVIAPCTNLVKKQTL